MKLIENIIALIRKDQKQDRVYRKATVVLEKPFPVINDRSRVNVNVSGKEYHTLTQ